MSHIQAFKVDPGGRAVNDRNPAMKPVLGGRAQVRICIAQISPAYLDLDATLERGCDAIAEAAENGADLVVFPEVWLAGYPYWTEGWDLDLQEWVAVRERFFDAAVLAPSRVTDRLGEAARTAGINVVMGCNEIDPRPGTATIYNSLLYFSRDGRFLGRHRKLLPTFSERTFWGSGNGEDLVVFETDIGRIGGLICGENLNTQLRAAMIAMGEDIHIAVFPGAFALHTGPRLEEWDNSGSFWGHSVMRAHSLEAGCYTVAVCACIKKSDIAEDFPYRDRMNIDYSRGGSAIVSPLGIPITGPTEGPGLIYADCPALAIKVFKAICDTMGHYGRADVTRLLLNRGSGWEDAGHRYRSGFEPRLDRDALERACDEHEIPRDAVEEAAHEKRLRISG